MKTTLIPNAALTLVVAVFTSLQVSSAFAGSNTKTEAVLYENKWIPSLDLKEVEISASRGNGAVCELKMYKGKFTPTVQLNEVTINASGIYGPNDVPEFAFVKPVSKGKKVDAVLYNGQFIPSIQLAEVTISSNRIASSQVPDDATKSASPSVFHVSARQTFDMIVNYMVDKSSNVLRHLIGGLDKN